MTRFKCVALSILALVQTQSALAAPAVSCAGGVLNVVKLGADGTAAGDTAAFLAAYTAATTKTSACYKVPIFVPGRQTPGWLGQPWPGHWPVITEPVTIEGAGANLTNFEGDGTGWPVFWVKAPGVKLSSFGFWGSPAVNIKLDAGSNGAVLSHIGCRSSGQIFIYAGGVSDITLTGVTSEVCGNSTTPNPLAGASLVFYNSSNITVNAYESFGAPNWSIAVAGSQNVVFNGGKTDYADAFNMTKPEVYVYNSSVAMNNGFYLAGTNNYELSVSGNSTFTGQNLVFGGGAIYASPTANIYYAPTSASSFTCNACTFLLDGPGWMAGKQPAAFEIDTAAAIKASGNVLSAFSPAKPVLTVSGNQTISVSKTTAPYQVQVTN